MSGPSHERATTPATGRKVGRTGVVAAVTVSLAAAGLVGVSIAATGGPLATDTFARTATASWGSADAGGAWTLRGTASRFSVAGGAGLVKLAADGASQSAYLASVSSSSTEVSGSLALDKIPTGGGAYTSLVARRVEGQGQYMARVQVASDGRLGLAVVRRSASGTDTVLGSSVVVPGTVAAWTGFNVRVRSTGTSPTTLQARAWVNGTPEPTTFAVTATDSTAGMQAAGSVGLFTYLSTGATNAPVTVAFDNLSATSLDTTPSPAPTTSSPAPTTPAPSPTTATPTPTPTTTTPTGSVGRSTSGAGALAIGSARYTPPAGALYVSPSGSDTAAGAAAAPLRTAATAIALAPAGSTIVLRAGTYHESVTIPSTKRLTLQNYPGEAVWFDGSVVVTGWVATGSVWRKDNWMPVFDHSPTYTPGAPDNTTANWSFVNAAYPMAAYPDQVWVDGTALAQVASVAAVTAGKFYVDRVNHKLYVGTDPNGRSVRSSDLSTAIAVASSGSVVRGVGVRRYATSVPEKGTVVLRAPGTTLENVAITDNATQGLYAGGINVGSGITIRDVTTERNGMLGIEASYADNITVERVRAVGNNTEHFNTSPVAGGMKIGRSRGIVIRDSVFQGNRGPGVWLDESCYDAKVLSNDLIGNVTHGLSVEISSKLVAADNLVMNNGGNGMKLNNVSSATVVNNTVLGSGATAVWFVQDTRVASNTSLPGHDPRQPLPDPTVTWILGPVTFQNNIVNGTGGTALMYVQDTALKRSGEQIGVKTDGNVWGRPSTSSPTWPIVWASGLINPYVYTTVSAFRTARAQELHGVEFTAKPVTDSSGVPTAAVAALDPTAAQPLSAAVAALIGRATGVRHLGVFFG